MLLKIKQIERKSDKISKTYGFKRERVISYSTQNPKVKTAVAGSVALIQQLIVVLA